MLIVVVADLDKTTIEQKVSQLAEWYKARSPFELKKHFSGFIKIHSRQNNAIWLPIM